MSGFIEAIKPWSPIIAIVILLGIGGQMEADDACRFDKHCVVD